MFRVHLDFYVLGLEIEIDGDWVHKSTARLYEETSVEFHQLHTRIYKIIAREATSSIMYTVIVEKLKNYYAYKVTMSLSRQVRGQTSSF